MWRIVSYSSRQARRLGNSGNDIHCSLFVEHGAADTDRLEDDGIGKIHGIIFLFITQAAVLI